MTRTIKLVGLDCGSTTTSVVVAEAALVTGALGRQEIAGVRPTFRSPTVLTPWAGQRIDAVALSNLIDQWLLAANTTGEEILGGGALVTGLAAQSDNAQDIAALVEARMAEAIIAKADHPRLESWLAFMGNCHALSVEHRDTPIMNLDIGGGTTNLAIGMAGQVLATGSLFVGARHFQFEPGTFRVTQLSRHAAELAGDLKVDARPGRVLTAGEIEAILRVDLCAIETAIGGAADTPDAQSARQLVQSTMSMPANLPSPAITLSGGVGQLVYDLREGKCELGRTHYGDLGVELACAIIDSPALSSRTAPWVPEGLGRATVYGLLQYSTELSGSTIYLPHPERLPLANVPILGSVGPDSSEARLRELLELAKACPKAACLQVDLPTTDAEAVRSLGSRLADLLGETATGTWPTLVLLAPANVGKSLGGYITRWGNQEVDLIVLDEVPRREAQFVRIGRMRQDIVPIWLYAAH